MDSKELQNAYSWRHATFEERRQTPGEMLREFHEVYLCTIGTEDDFNGPEQEMRMDLMREEMKELEGARDAHDLIEYLDALADIVYIAYGNALHLGYNLDPILEEVHRSNMSKLGEDGKPIYREDGKVLKGPNYSPPDIAGVIGK